MRKTLRAVALVLWSVGLSAGLQHSARAGVPTEEPPAVVVFQNAGWPEAERRLLAELGLLDVRLVRRDAPPSIATRVTAARRLKAAAAVAITRSAEGLGVVWAWVDTDGVGRVTSRTVDESAADTALLAVDLVKAGLVAIERLPGPAAPEPAAPSVESHVAAIRGRVGLGLGARVGGDGIGPSVVLAADAGLLMLERLVVGVAGAWGPGPGTVVAPGRGEATLATASLMGWVGIATLPQSSPVQLEASLGGGVLWAWVTSATGALADIGDLASTGVLGLRAALILAAESWLDVTLCAEVLLAPHAIELDDAGQEVGRLGLPLVDVTAGLRVRL